MGVVKPPSPRTGRSGPNLVSAKSMCCGRATRAGYQREDGDESDDAALHSPDSPRCRRDLLNRLVG